VFGKLIEMSRVRDLGCCVGAVGRVKDYYFPVGLIRRQPVEPGDNCESRILQAPAIKKRL